MSEVKDWIWFPKRQVSYFQDETEPRLFTDEFVKYVPKSTYDELKAREKKLLEVIKLQRKALSRLVNSEVVKQAPFINYSEAYCDAKEAIAQTEAIMKDIGVGL